MGLTDEQWEVLAPLIEACRPAAKVPPRHLRRTISAIIWRHDNGAKWRSLPEALGHAGGLGFQRSVRVTLALINPRMEGCCASWQALGQASPRSRERPVTSPWRFDRKSS